MAIELVDFDVNQTEFPSERSKEIWYWGKRIVPLELSLAEITDPELREGCTQIHRFTQELFADMYLNPDRYPFIHVGPVFGRFVKYGAVIDESGYKWILPSDRYNKYIRNRFGGSETIFTRFGFKTAEVGSNTILSNEQYPLLLKYWYLTPQLSGNRSSHLICDFRVFAKKFKLTLDDFLRTQADRDKVYYNELHEYALSKGAVLKTHFQYRRFRYIYNNECAMVFEDLFIHPSVVVPYNNQYSTKRNPWTSFDLFMTIVDKQPDIDELAQYIQKQICNCSACSDRGCGHELDIYGVRRIAASCHPEISKCLDEQPGAFAYDMHMLKRMIDIRVEQIDHYDR